MLSEQIVQLGPMGVLAGLSAGWIAETFLARRGYGLIVDLGVGVGAGLLGGGLFLALSGLPAGMLAIFTAGFVLAIGVILAQRLAWPCAPGARERNVRQRFAELGSSAPGERKPASELPGDDNRRTGRPVPTRPLLRMATTGIYLLRGVPVDLQRAARSRAVRERTTLCHVLRQGLGEYAAGTWTPDELPEAPDPGIHAPPR